MAEELKGSFLVSFQNVSVKRGGNELILRETDFHLPVNGVYALCGPSGCGKSTICQVITKSLPISSGSVTYWDKDLAIPGKDIGNFKSPLVQEL